MKPNKITTTTLALLAAAVFTTSAHAAAANGSVILGVYDVGGSPSPDSYEANLGAVNTLTNGETWSLGSTAEGVFSSDSSASLVFAIAADGGSVGGGGLAAKEIVVTDSVGGTITPPSANTTEVTNIGTMYTEYGAGTTTALTSGTGYTDIEVLDSQTGSFDKTVNLNGGSFGLASNAVPSILADYTPTSVVDFEEIPNGATSPTLLGTFTITSGGNVTFNTPSITAVPEPSTYALLAGGLFALWIFKRRRTNA